MPTITIDPVTRLEGHLKIEVTVDTVGGVQQVVDARAGGTLFRGLENILLNRHPFDARHLTQRICGVCPISHGLAAVLALDAACGVLVPPNGRIMRNLVAGCNLVDSHILNFYTLSLLDYIGGPNMPPWQPAWSVDRRFSAEQNAVLVEHYLTALDVRRKIQEAGAIFAGRLPLSPAFIPGGFTTQPSAADVTNFTNYLNLIIPFIQNTYIPDVQTLAAVYADYKQVGRGYGNLLAYGGFDLDDSGSNKLFQRGRVENGATAVQPVDVQAIIEQVDYSWYANSRAVVPLDDDLFVVGSGGRNPAVGVTNPVDPASKPAAYSWIKAPRYSQQPYEAGPLARMWIDGDYRLGISVMDRHLARAAEALKLAQAMLTWVAQIDPGAAVNVPASVPDTAATAGLTEAPRGALGHWLQISKGKIARYQVVTPTCWNASPRDRAGQRGPLEQALMGVALQDLNQPVEVVRVIHSFDPCMACAVHVLRPGEGKKLSTIA